MKQIRIPRPFGLTPMMKQYHQSNNTELLHKTRLMVAQCWMLNGGNILGRILTIYELSHFLGCSVGELNNFMSNQMLNSSIWNDDNREHVVEQVIGTSISWSLDDRMMLDRQLKILMESQGDSFKPFVSGEVNRALAMRISSSNSMAQLVKSLTTLQGPGSLFGINSKQNQGPTEGLGRDEAIVIIQQHLLNNGHDEKTYIEEQGFLEGCPEVVATKQEGRNTVKEGLNIKKTELVETIDNYKGSLGESDKVHHEMRREIEERIILEGDDPEFEKY